MHQLYSYLNNNLKRKELIYAKLRKCVRGGVETPSVTPTSISGEINIKKVGHVVNATIAVTPTVSGFSNVATNFPPALFTNRFTGVVASSGQISKSFCSVESTGLCRVNCTGEINVQLLFSFTYITD